MNRKWDDVDLGKGRTFKGGRGRQRRGVLFPADRLMVCSVCQTAGAVISSSTWDSTSPAASTSGIPTVAFSTSVTGHCWQNFSNLGYKGKAEQFVINGSEPFPVSLWKEYFFPLFFSDKWGWNNAGLLWGRSWIKECPSVSINPKCSDICFPLGGRNWGCHRIIRAWCPERCVHCSTRYHRWLSLFLCLRGRDPPSWRSRRCVYRCFLQMSPSRNSFHWLLALIACFPSSFCVYQLPSSELSAAFLFLSLICLLVPLTLT